ncbi:S-adenosyl-L-methionine-dependent methyltransferase [Glarea lozoyensis ATCC 20868]|uniref:S-adenosyl-L-methionine-dependent methyltransferase n=1 Tax=Glarea lozoyensis (strain ATCC 20868 / MF5171) TaxID=1116229 RepID=S3DWU1_GLAL2|nr:S-adenosyl-L-methionine-dependent methyltransferase [Glarea lozoyensis ATCC 20868]EPE36411.1 S-adenosyl-L-methionine-dependent methyltransferase [Glarea lozoyensis ATCC 20868]
MSADNLGELNRKHMNDVGESAFKQQWIVDLGNQITAYILAHLEWLGTPPNKTEKPMKLLDYACGNGLISKALLPHVSTIRGIDVSDKMVDLYNSPARTNNADMSAIQADLLAPTDAMLDALIKGEYSDFDIAVTSMALHHFADPQLMLTKLVERLAIGGRILVIDWANEAVADWPAEGVLKEAGLGDVRHTLNDSVFTEKSVVELLKGAGCREAEFVLCPETSKLPGVFGEKRLFFGLGTK